MASPLSAGRHRRQVYWPALSLPGQASGARLGGADIHARLPGWLVRMPSSRRQCSGDRLECRASQGCFPATALLMNWLVVDEFTRVTLLSTAP